MGSLLHRVTGSLDFRLWRMQLSGFQEVSKHVFLRLYTGSQWNSWAGINHTYLFSWRVFKYLLIYTTLHPCILARYTLSMTLSFCFFVVHFSPGETYSILSSGLHVQDIWMLMTGKPMQLVIRVRASFGFCHQRHHLIWYFWGGIISSTLLGPMLCVVLWPFKLKLKGPIFSFKENLLE